MFYFVKKNATQNHNRESIQPQRWKNAEMSSPPPPQELNVHEIQRPNSNQFHRMNKKNGESPVIHPIHTAATVKMHHETKLATIWPVIDGARGRTALAGVNFLIGELFYCALGFCENKQMKNSATSSPSPHHFTFMRRACSKRSSWFNFIFLSYHFVVCLDSYFLFQFSFRSKR